jgi:hypothetical protein
MTSGREPRTGLPSLGAGIIFAWNLVAEDVLLD